MKRHKPITWWVVKEPGPRGLLMPQTAAFFRAESISLFLRYCGKDMDDRAAWRQLLSEGYSAIRVVVKDTAK